ncbi:MAG: hypothetical protein H0T43_06725, partial [Solirubrobacterales bacterium]|nr:hypothetical protein [Solirubrobacterales bacterium]
MHPAEHRALRELHATARQLREHWATLANRLETQDARVGAGSLLRAGSHDARELLGELAEQTAARELYGRTAAQGVGVQLAAGRAGLLDHALEVNQALRFATLDVQHVVTLLAYLERLARRRGDAPLAAFEAGWHERMAGHEDAIRTAAVAAGDDPDQAIRPASPGMAGRVGHG